MEIRNRKDYRVKFNKFSAWCSEQKIYSHAASLSDCVDFLTSLFQAGLNYCTISGYRSMLSIMLSRLMAHQ